MTSSPAPVPNQKGVKKNLAIFGVLAIAGVLMLAVSVVIGFVLIVIAEVFFVTAYRRFSKRAEPAA
jgi:heme O synthase-like polyprenyltransferase